MIFKDPEENVEEETSRGTYRYLYERAVIDLRVRVQRHHRNGTIFQEDRPLDRGDVGVRWYFLILVVVVIVEIVVVIQHRVDRGFGARTNGTTAIDSCVASNRSNRAMSPFASLRAEVISYI